MGTAATTSPGAACPAHEQKRYCAISSCCCVVVIALLAVRFERRLVALSFVDPTLDCGRRWPVGRSAPTWVVDHRKHCCCFVLVVVDGLSPCPFLLLSVAGAVVVSRHSRLTGPGTSTGGEAEEGPAEYALYLLQPFSPPAPPLVCARIMHAQVLG